MPDDSNPLLIPRFRIPFDQIRAEHVEPAVDGAAAARPRVRLEALAAAPGPRTFDNTMHALDDMTEPLDYAMGVVRHLESVATYPELRAAFNAVQPEVSAFYSGIPLNEGLVESLKKFAATAEGRHLDRRAPALPDQDHGRVPPPRRRARPRRQEAPGSRSTSS